MRPLVCVALLAAAAVSTPDRLKPAQLDALHRARVEWARTRVVHPQQGIYQDLRAILHVHAEDAPHTKGTRAQVAAAAREAGVSIVAWTDHNAPRVEAWRGVRDGVLYLSGAEKEPHLLFPAPSGGLKFLAHLEQHPDEPSDGLAGMEVYNRHADFERNTAFAKYLESTANNAGAWRSFASQFREYPDEIFAAGTSPLSDYVARYDREIAKHPFTAVAGNDAHRNTIIKGLVLDPYEVAFRFVSTHVLARELDEAMVRSSLAGGHAYVAFDWLCDPAGFSFTGQNSLGLFEMGDQVPMIPGTRVAARLPVTGHARLIHNGEVVFETRGKEFQYSPSEPGAYRLEVGLEAAGEERPWIFSNPLYLYKPTLAELALPPSRIDDNVRVVKDVDYAGDGVPKHRLDLYLPKDKTNFPVLFFVHGGSWRSGDRSQYPSVGNRFAKLGIGVVIPSYRLMPGDPHPAQIEDVASAFAWTVRNIAGHGGDPRKIVTAGHSAGGHLVSLLALDRRYLAKHELTPANIRGVATVSGAYDVRVLPAFGQSTDERWDASPLKYVERGAPPFTVLYCQWDYASLPAQAREFDRALRRAFVTSRTAYIPGESHISEMVHLWKDNDATAREMLDFVETVTR